MSTNTQTRFLYLIRHGESEYNQKNLFCGWHDADLSAKGKTEASTAAITIKDVIEKNGPIVKLFTSRLQRAQKTLKIIQSNVPSIADLKTEIAWQLNERHYGALQGLSKSETAAKYGESQVALWRRSFDVAPPLLEEDSAANPKKDPLYSDVDKNLLPLGESLELTIKRVLPFFEKTITEDLKTGNLLISAHGNSIRSILKHVASIPPNEISTLEIPTCIPIQIRFEVDSTNNLVFKDYKFLADEEALKAAQAKVKAQGKAASSSTN